MFDYLYMHIPRYLLPSMVVIKLICRMVAYPSPGAVSPNGVTVNSSNPTLSRYPPPLQSPLVGLLGLAVLSLRPDC